MPTIVADRVARLLRDHPLVDGHNDLPWAARELAAYDLDVLDLATPVAAMLSTAISPMVSQARVSTRTTFTMLLP